MFGRPSFGITALFIHAVNQMLKALHIPDVMSVYVAMAFAVTFIPGADIVPAITAASVLAHLSHSICV